MTGRDEFGGEGEEPRPQPPEVVMRREGPPPPPGQQSPYSQLGESGQELDWPLDLDNGSTPPGPPPRSTLPPFLVGILVGVALATVSIVSFTLFRNDSNETTGPTLATPAVSAPADTTTSTTVTTIVLETTTSSTSVPPPPPIDAAGDPLPLEDLAMASSGLGVLRFGDDGNQTLGRLAATFGAPDSDSGTLISDGEFGTCPGDPVRIVRWGPLAVVVVNPDSAPVFSGYRLDVGFGGLESPAADLRTVSGMRASDTVETLQSIYAGFTIEFVTKEDVGLIFELRNAGGDLLLWGPVTSEDATGKVSGIYSPDPCSA